MLVFVFNNFLCIYVLKDIYWCLNSSCLNSHISAVGLLFGDGGGGGGNASYYYYIHTNTDVHYITIGLG